MAAGCGLLAGLLLASSLASPLLSVSPLLGISPKDEKYYAGSVIPCRDGSKSFPRDRLNDGFCDCPDGTDEPAKWSEVLKQNKCTSACPESVFYCKNVGDRPRYLFSSRVNDHICDCCDGTDEYDGGIICPNTCLKEENSLINKSDTKYSTEMKFNHVNVLERKNKVDLDDLIGKLEGLRVIIIIELVSVIWLVTLCIRHSRTLKRHLSWRNKITC